MRYKIFISSVQKEFAEERRLRSNYLQKDTLLRKFFDTFVFEDISAKDQSPEQTYFNEVKHCDIYLAILGKEFGHEFEDGTSPTQREFTVATENNKFRLTFLLNATENERHPKEDLFIKQISQDLIYGTFSSSSELLSNVYSSLIDFLGEKGDLRVEPFDKSANRDATWEDISDEKIEWFLAISRRERSFPLPIDTNREKLFTHLNLLNRGKLSNAAVLLFGKAPQRFFLTSEVKCAHFHGTRVEKPIPFYQVYKGNLFELVDQAVNFVLSKIDYAVGERTHGATVSTAYEIPPEVIEEAVVNAVAHRDYDSTASVQVMLFADRLEISNPGQLPQQLPIENLKKDHASYPKNPLMAEVLYLAKYVERMGTGIQDMVKRSVDYGLAEPEFVMRDCFVTIIRRKKNIALKKIETGGQTGGQTLTDIQKQIADYMINNPMITRKELSANLKINASAVQKHIDKLKREGIIKREGADFGGKWVVERQESWCTEDCDEYNG